MLGDFGLSLIMTDGKAFMKTLSGSFGYCAPEVGNGVEVTEKIDIWSLGICLYEMAVAYKPTVLDNQIGVTGVIPFWDQDWKGLDLLRDLITKMLKVKPEDRISTQDALNHSFFDNEEDEFNKYE